LRVEGSGPAEVRGSSAVRGGGLSFAGLDSWGDGRGRNGRASMVTPGEASWSCRGRRSEVKGVVEDSPGEVSISRGTLEGTPREMTGVMLVGTPGERIDVARSRTPGEEQGATLERGAAGRTGVSLVRTGGCR
jgi:hypothetical protein